MTEEFEGQANVLQLNVVEPDNAALQQHFGVRGHPTFVVLNRNGAVTATFVGPQDAERLRSALANIVFE